MSEQLERATQRFESQECRVDDSISMEIKWLKQDVLASSEISESDLSKIFCNYPEFKELSKEKKKDLFDGLKLLKKSMWVDFVKALLLNQSIDIDWKSYKIDRKIPLNNIQALIDDVRELEAKRDLSTLWTIVLTLNELQSLEVILAWEWTRQDLKNFLKEQAKENVTSKQILVWTQMETKFSKALWTKENFYDFCDKLDNVWNIYLWTQLWYLSKDVVRNMATGSWFAVMNMFSQIWWEALQATFLTRLKNINPTDPTTIFTQMMMTMADKSQFQLVDRTAEFYNILSSNDIKSVVGDWEWNEILTNPMKYQEIMKDFIFGKLSKEDLIKQIKNSQKNSKFSGLNDADHKALVTIAEKYAKWMDDKTIKAVSTWWNIANDIMNTLNTAKDKWREVMKNNADTIISVKEMFQSFWFWDTFMKIFWFIFKLLGWGSFDEFEEEAGSDFVWKVDSTMKRWKRLNKSFKWKLDLSSIKDKDINTLTYEESQLYFRNVFWDWDWTNLAFNLSKKSPVFLTRIANLAKHEWWWNFGMVNDDPNKDSKQSNIWTFQISARFWATDNVVLKYLRWIKKWLELNWTSTQVVDDLLKDPKYKNLTASNYAEAVKDFQSKLKSAWLNLEQQDLLSWIWFVSDKKDSEDIFNKLWDQNLSTKDLVKLISNRIQVWIEAIWQDVASMENDRVWDLAKWAEKPANA